MIAVPLACSSTTAGEHQQASLGGAAGDGSGGGSASSGGSGSGPASGGTGSSAGTGSSSGVGGKPISEDTPPSIVSVSPESGATGVASDAAIVIQFDKPMNRETVEAAFAFGELQPSVDYSFGWNAAGDTLTVTPTAPFAYAEGSLSVAANAYEFSVGASAQDTFGHALTNPLTAEFSTKRRISQLLGFHPALTLACDAAIGCATAFTVGDTASNQERKYFATFQMSDVANGAEIESATFTLELTKLTGAVSELGALQALHVSYQTASAAELEATPLSPTPVVFSTVGSIGEKSMNVTSFFQESYAARLTNSNLFQLRFEFLSAPSSDDQMDLAHFEDYQSMKLAVQYLAP